MHRYCTTSLLSEKFFIESPRETERASTAALLVIITISNSMNKVKKTLKMHMEGVFRQRVRLSGVNIREGSLDFGDNGEGCGSDLTIIHSSPDDRKKMMDTWVDMRAKENSEDCRKQWKDVHVPLKILIVVVGTLGDILPLIQLATIQQRRYGHKISFATHESHKKVVEAAGIKFQSIATSPEILSRFMVNWMNAATTPSDLLSSLRKHANGIHEMIMSCKDAAIGVDGELPHAVISNPPCFAHAALAESLACPLHIMFAQPWSSTSAFPHPLANCILGPALGLLPGRSEEERNLLSHELVSRVLYCGTESSLISLRSMLGLAPARVGEGHWDVIRLKKVPFSGLFSEALLPRPPDWEDHVQIVGSCKAAGDKEENETSQTSAGSDLPLYVGFGSMALDHPSMTTLLKTLLQAAAIANTRLLVHLQSWSCITVETFQELAEDAAFQARLISKTSESDEIGTVPVAVNTHVDLIIAEAIARACSKRGEDATSTPPILPLERAVPVPLSLMPHGHSRGQWKASDAELLVGHVDHAALFRRVRGCIHHGGAGTTVAGLRQSLPTFILWFFGDQELWGKAISDRGAGPKPIRASQLTLSQAVEALNILTSTAALDAATAIAASLRKEDGANRAAEHFQQNFPYHTALCHLSLLMGEYRMAEVRCPTCDIIMTVEAFERSHYGRDGEILLNHHPSPLGTADWSPSQSPSSLSEGLGVGALGMARCVAGGLLDSVMLPAQGSRAGLRGALCGLAQGCSSLAKGVSKAGEAMAVKVAQGLQGPAPLTFSFVSEGSLGARLRFEEHMSRPGCREEEQGQFYSEREVDSVDEELRARDEGFKVALQVALAVQDVMQEIRAYHGRAGASRYSLEISELASFARTLCIIPAVDSTGGEDEWPPICLPQTAFCTSTSTSTRPSVSTSSSDSWSDVTSMVPELPSQLEIEHALSTSLCNGREEAFLADLLLFFRAP